MNETTVIIGGGIAGLYAAYKLQAHGPVIVLESASVAGGRVGTAKFAGIDVVTGAGIGRKQKDVLLQKLLSELDIPTTEFIVRHQHVTTNISTVSNTLNILKKAYAASQLKPVPPKPQTFKSYATKVLGADAYAAFVEATGYSDYEKEDVQRTLYAYGMDDNMAGWTGLYIPWRKLISSLVKVIGKKHIYLNTCVTSISTESADITEIHTSNPKHPVLYAKNVIVATTIDSLRTLFPTNTIYARHIHGQPFLRQYAQFSQTTRETMHVAVPMLTIVKAPLQEIIPISPQKGVYMIAYSDNKSAEKLHGCEDKEYWARLVEQSLSLAPRSLCITRMQSHYWDVGTHYFSPSAQVEASPTSFIAKAQHPIAHRRVWTVGEVVAPHQGWVEGALESVESIIGELKQ